MNWDTFKGKFHSSWHPYVKKFIESNECNKIYSFLKKQTGEIAPKSHLTFRPFNQPLKEVKVVVIFEEPYSEKHNDIQFADGIPLSCDYVDKMHPQLDAFYNAMEKEFYDLNLHILKEKNLDFYISRGVLFLNSSFTTEIGAPEKHKGLWVPFMKHLIKNVFTKHVLPHFCLVTFFTKHEIPIVFCGWDVQREYKVVLDPIYPWFIIQQPISEAKIGVPWKTDSVFTKLNEYLWEKTEKEDVMWVNMDVPY